MYSKKPMLKVPTMMQNERVRESMKTCNCFTVSPFHNLPLHQHFHLSNMPLKLLNCPLLLLTTSNFESICKFSSGVFLFCLFVGFMLCVCSFFIILCSRVFMIFCVYFSNSVSIFSIRCPLFVRSCNLPIFCHC